MKKSPHHLKHLREKAIKEAQKTADTDITPEEMIENPHWKEQFEPHEQLLPHHLSHQKKIPSKRTSTHDIHVETEPAHMEHPNQYTMKKTQDKNQAMTKSLNKKLSKKHIKTHKDEH